MRNLSWGGIAAGIFLVAIVARVMKDPHGAATILATGGNVLTGETHQLISG
jgi:hypothetical protein